MLALNLASTPALVTTDPRDICRPLLLSFFSALGSLCLFRTRCAHFSCGKEIAAASWAAGEPFNPSLSLSLSPSVLSRRRFRVWDSHIMQFIIMRLFITP